MLNSLRIKNFVLIEDSTLNFDKGFTAITGETGSGKSILLQSLNLLSGDRADFSVIGNNGDKSIVEAKFTEQSDALKHILTQLDLDVEDELILRREITKNGRSRAFVNDTPIQLADMKLIANNLIEINSQHQTIELKDSKFQMQVLDSLAGSETELKEFQELFKTKISLEKKLENLENEYNEKVKIADYNDFQLAEIQSLELLNYNYEQAAIDLVKYEQSDELKLAYQNIQHSLSDDEFSVEPKLKNLLIQISKISGQDEKLKDLETRLKSTLIELNDISNEATTELENLEVDPSLMQELGNKLDKYNSILKKQQVTNQKELIEILKNLESGSSNLIDLELEVSKFKKELEILSTQTNNAAEKLSAKRKSSVASIEKNIVAHLDGLKMPETRIQFTLTERAKLGELGNDDLQILFSPNKGMEISPIQKSASGGELSRLMLVLKKMLSTNKSLPTILFDEIDTGVSGDVAEKIGNTLKAMGENMQLIAITHLPQVAAKASAHKLVVKENIKDATYTKVLDLNTENRITEIARLISGEQISDTALSHAKALMN